MGGDAGERGQAPRSWFGPGSAIDEALSRVETLFEVGASALVPVATIGVPFLLAVLAYLVVPFELSPQLLGDNSAGDEEYVSFSPPVGYPGDAPPDDRPIEAVPAPQGDPSAPAARPPAPDPSPRGEAPDAPGGDPLPTAGHGAPEGSPTAQGPAAPAPGGRTRKCTPPDNPRIRKAPGEKDWRVERRLLDYYATHIRALDDLGWVAHWKAEDGSRKGFKIGGLRCGNDAWMAGLRSGDVVLSVNGTKVGSIIEGIAAYARYRRADVIDLEILRKGHVEVHHYRMY